MNTKLYKSNDSVIIAGVCGGIAEYLGFDATVLRIIWLLFFGVSIWFYIALAILMPSRPKLL